MTDKWIKAAPWIWTIGLFVVWEGVAIECAESIDKRHSLKL